MTSLLGAVATALALCEAPVPAPHVLAADSSLARLFTEGKTWVDFLGAAQRRKEQWERNFSAATVPDALLTRARAAATGGPWKLLVVAVDGCSDSVNTIPYLARLVTQLVGVEMKIVGSDVGRGIMDTHRTPDGRGATPTVLLLDAEYRERGCWVERPAPLVAWLSTEKSRRGENELFEGKMQWYDNDRGASTLEDLVAMLERAAAGQPACTATR